MLNLICRVTMMLNYSYMMFHNSSWSVMSVLRYLYITKKDWLLDRVRNELHCPAKKKLFKMGLSRPL